MKVGKYLWQLMGKNYKVGNLKNVDPDQFRSFIQGLPGYRDAQSEGYIDPSCQRELSIQFEWGHNHDFGSFYMPGLMKDRHIEILAAFIVEYGLDKDLTGKSVLDIGCWTGGTSLLMAAMGAEVIAIEEVQKYADCLSYLANAFGIENLHIENRSLFSLNESKYYDRFDFVLYSGVIYHVTDPILSLRIVFNSLKNGGKCLLETRASEGSGIYCRYGTREPKEKRIVSKAETLVGGWAWFVPTLPALMHMMRDVGFNIEKATFHGESRALAIGVRNNHVDMLRAGLSKPDIR